MGAQPPGIEGVDDHDVVDASVDGIDDLGIQVCERSSSVHPVVVGNGPDPCHQVSLAQHPEGVGSSVAPGCRQSSILDISILQVGQTAGGGSEAHVQQFAAGLMADNADFVTDWREVATAG